MASALGGRSPSLADYVRGREDHPGGDRRRSVLMLTILAVPYPMGFFAKGVDGGIDNPRTRLGTLGDLQEPEACACGDVVSHRSPYHHFVSNETSSVSRVPAPR